MRKLNWPKNKDFALWLTHDVDRVKKTYQMITHFFKDRRAYHIKSIFLKPNPYWTFDKIMEIEQKHNVRSTFFFLNESKKLNILKPNTYKLALGRYNIHEKKIKNIINRLNDGNWEIGVHGSYDSYTNQNLLKKEKIELEKILKKKVIGIRQHYLNLNIPETWKIQQKVGFKYDSSFGFRDKIGFRDKKTFPFNPFNDEFLVIPNNIMDVGLFSSSKNLKESWWKCKDLIKFIEKKKGLLTINWHTQRFNDKEFPNQSDIYEKIIKECKKRNAYICTGDEIFKLSKKGE